MNKKIFTILAVCLMLFVGCGENEIVNTYEQSDLSNTLYPSQIKTQGQDYSIFSEIISVLQ